MKLWSILGNSQRLDGGAMFGNAPRAMWEKWIVPDADNRIPLACRALLAQDLDGKNVLFETGIGAFFEPKLRERYGVVEDNHVLLDSLRDELGESCSLGVMEDDALCYVARSEASRIMAVGLKVGSTLPLYPTSMGRVLLAGRSHEEQDAYFARTQVRALTPHTIVDIPRLLVTIRRAAADGYALVAL